VCVAEFVNVWLRQFGEIFVNKRFKALEIGIPGVGVLRGDPTENVFANSPMGVGFFLVFS